MFAQQVPDATRPESNQHVSQGNLGLNEKIRVLDSDVYPDPDPHSIGSVDPDTEVENEGTIKIFGVFPKKLYFSSLNLKTKKLIFKV